MHITGKKKRTGNVRNGMNSRVDALTKLKKINKRGKKQYFCFAICCPLSFTV